MVFVNWPFEQQKVCAFLNAGGWKTLRIRPGAQQEEIAEILEKWNNPKDEHEVIVLSTKTASLGLNLHQACHRLIIYSLPENINTLIQVIGRVHRIGQKFIQYVYILTQDSSYDQHLRAKCVEKFVHQILGEAAVYTFNTEGVRQTVLTAQYIESLANNVRNRPDRDEVEGAFISWQVYRHMSHLLGFRCSPLGWDSTELGLKNDLQSHLDHPGRVRATMPHEIALLNSGTDDANGFVNSKHPVLRLGKSLLSGPDLLG